MASEAREFVGEMNRTRAMLEMWETRRAAEKAGRAARRPQEEPEGEATVFATPAQAVRKAARRVNARRKR
jgi:hypothetical protein